MSTEGHGEKVARAAENEADAHDAVLAGITFTHKALKPQNLPSMVSKSSATQSVPQQRQQGGAGRQLVLSIGNIWTWVFNSFSNGAHPWLKFVPSNVITPRPMFQIRGDRWDLWFRLDHHIN
jgi:hypothetical protein